METPLKMVMATKDAAEWLQFDIRKNYFLLAGFAGRACWVSVFMVYRRMNARKLSVSLRRRPWLAEPPGECPASLCKKSALANSNQLDLQARRQRIL